MSPTDLHGIAQTLLHQAEEKGFIVPRDIRAALTAAKLDDDLWKDVLTLLGPALSLRNGRYHFVSPGLARMRARAHQDQRHQRAIQRSVRQLIRQYHKTACEIERRAQARIELVRPVQILTSDNRTLNLLTRDISTTGLRLLGSHQLQGQRIQVWIPPPTEGRPAFCYSVQMLWSALVADGLYESGGMFLELVAEQG